MVDDLLAFGEGARVGGADEVDDADALGVGIGDAVDRRQVAYAKGGQEAADAVVDARKAFGGIGSVQLVGAATSFETQL